MWLLRKYKCTLTDQINMKVYTICMYVYMHRLAISVHTCKHEPEVGVFIIDDVTIVDVVATGGAVEIATGQVIGLDVVVVVVNTAVEITGVAMCDKLKQCSSID